MQISYEPPKLRVKFEREFGENKQEVVKSLMSMSDVDIEFAEPEGIYSAILRDELDPEECEHQLIRASRSYPPKMEDVKFNKYL